MCNTAIQKAMENAEASVNMEGLYVSDLSKELCEKLLKKEITFEEYIRLITADCYEGTTCLLNKLGIRDENKLAEIEAGITFAKAVMLEEAPIDDDFSFEHFKKIHEFLLCDLYEWAGQVRTVDSSKKRTMFLDASSIESIGTKCFSKVKKGYFENSIIIPD